MHEFLRTSYTISGRNAPPGGLTAAAVYGILLTIGSTISTGLEFHPPEPDFIFLRDCFGPPRKPRNRKGKAVAYPKSARTRTDILSAARGLFLEKGYHDTTIKDIADKAGIVHTSIYYYFRNKEMIARDIFEGVVQRIVAALDEVREAKPDPLLEMILSYMLIYRFVALDGATQTFYFDFADSAELYREGMDSLRSACLRDPGTFFQEHGQTLSESEIAAFLLTSEAYAKALFKGVARGDLDFTMEQAMDYLCRHILLPDTWISEEEYRKTFREALEICESMVLAGEEEPRG